MTTEATGRGTSLAQSLVWFAGSYAVAIAGYLVINATASRFLGPTEFGHFVIIYTTSIVIVQLGLLGVHREGVREAARIRNRDDAALPTLRHGVSAVSWIALPVCALASGAVAWFLAGGADQDRAVAAVGVGVLVLLSGHQKLWANFLRGFGHVRFASMLEGRAGGALVSVIQGVAVVVVAVAFPEWGLAGVLGALAIGYVLPIIVAWRIVARRWRHVPRASNPARELGSVGRRNWRFMVVQLVMNVSQFVELWIAGLVLSSYDTSMFAGAQRIAALIAFPITAIQVVFSPTISRLWAGNDRQQMERVLRTGAFFSGIVSVVVWLPMVVAPGFVLGTVLGDDFRGGALVLALLSTGYLTNALTGLCGATLSMTHHEGRTALVMSIGLATRAAAGVLCAVVLGLQGLALVAAVVIVVVNLVLWWSALRLVGVNTLPTLRPRLRLLRQTRG